jgi:hypothetical protein
LDTKPGGPTHVGPELGEKPRADGADSALSEIEYARALQRVHEIRPIAFDT